METENEKAVLRAIRDPQYLGYKPSYFHDYPPLMLTELVERTGLDMQAVSDAVDALVGKKILTDQLRPREWAIEGQKSETPDFYCVGYRICDNVLAESACSQL